MSFDYSVGSEATATPYHRKDLKIRPKTAGMMWFTGLRGSVGYACVRTFPDALGHQKDFMMTTMALVLITVFVLGGTTECALACFKIKIGVDEETYMKERLREPVISSWIIKFGTCSFWLRRSFQRSLHTISVSLLRLSESCFFFCPSTPSTYSPMQNENISSRM